MLGHVSPSIAFQVLGQVTTKITIKKLQQTFVEHSEWNMEHIFLTLVLCKYTGRENILFIVTVTLMHSGCVIFSSQNEKLPLASCTTAPEALNENCKNGHALAFLI